MMRAETTKNSGGSRARQEYTVAIQRPSRKAGSTTAGHRRGTRRLCEGDSLSQHAPA